MLRLVSLSIISFLLIFISSCGDEGPNESVSEADQLELLANIGDNIILPAYNTLDVAASGMVIQFEEFENEMTEEKLVDLQNSLESIRLAWQDCNLFDFGPASTQAIAGVFNTFPVDRKAIERNIENGNFNLVSLASADERGFGALGFLFHGTGNETNLEIVEVFTNSPNRVTYARTIIEQIKEGTSSTRDEWMANGGNFINTFRTSTGTSVGSSLNLLINAVIQSLERRTRDGKIGIPVGLRTLEVPVPEAIEALYAGYSVELAQANIRAYQRVFNPVNGDGLLDYLELVGGTDLSAEITTAFTNSINAIDQLQEPFQEEVENNPGPANTAIVELQRLIVLLKTEFTSRVGISITFQDNDGD